MEDLTCMQLLYRKNAVSLPFDNQSNYLRNCNLNEKVRNLFQQSICNCLFYIQFLFKHLHYDMKTCKISKVLQLIFKYRNENLDFKRLLSKIHVMFIANGLRYLNTNLMYIS